MGDLISHPRIVCVGSNLESEVALKCMLINEINIITLVTLPSGSKNISDYVDLHDLCFQNKIPVIDTNNINDSSTSSKIKSFNPDYIFILGWSQILKKNILDIPNKFVVGSHPSLLPEGKGRAPVPWTIIQGLSSSAITLFRMDEGVDSGQILIQKIIDFNSEINATELYNLVAENLGIAFVELHNQILSNTITFSEQNMTKGSYRSKRTEKDGLIDFNLSAYEIDKLIRAVTHPYPGAYTFYNNQKVSVFHSSLVSLPSYIGTIGQIMIIDERGVLVQSRTRPLWLDNIYIQGKKVNNHFFKIGTKFGYNVEEEINFLRTELKKLKKIILNDKI